MTFTQHASHRFTDGRTVAVGTDRRGRWLLALDGPGGLETTIRFNRIDVERGRIVTVARTAEGRRVETGSLAGSPPEYGAVGSFLAAFADDPEVGKRVAGL